MTGLPAISPTHEPAAIRNGDAAAKRAYQVGLSFEQLLVDQLSQVLATTATGDGSSAAGSGGDSSSAYAGMLPQTLTQSIMAGGGTGIAMQLAGALDPALRGKS